jgi:hypothetical protein
MNERSQVDAKKPYVKPELEELGRLHDVTGGWLDFGDIISQILGGRGGGGGGGGGGPRGGSR